MPRNRPVPRRPHHHQRVARGEFARGLVVSGVLAAIFVAAFALGTDLLDTNRHKPRTIGIGLASQHHDDNLATGSIVFVPVVGDECRKNVIDNATWTVREIGRIPCDQALAADRHPRNGTASRLGVIRDSFRGNGH